MLEAIGGHLAQPRRRDASERSLAVDCPPPMRVLYRRRGMA